MFKNLPILPGLQEIRAEVPVLGNQWHFCDGFPKGLNSSQTRTSQHYKKLPSVGVGLTAEFMRFPKAETAG